MIIPLAPFVLDRRWWDHQDRRTRTSAVPANRAGAQRVLLLAMRSGSHACPVSLAPESQ